MPVNSNISGNLFQRFKLLIDQYISEMINQLSKAFQKRISDYETRIKQCEIFIISLQEKRAKDKSQKTMVSINQAINKIQFDIEKLLQSSHYQQVLKQTSYMNVIGSNSQTIQHSKISKILNNQRCKIQNSKIINLSKRINKLTNPSKRYYCKPGLINNIKKYSFSVQNSQFTQNNIMNSQISLQQSFFPNILSSNQQKTKYLKQTIQTLVKLIKQQQDCRLLRFHLKNALLKVQKMSDSKESFNEKNSEKGRMSASQTEVSIQKDFSPKMQQAQQQQRGKQKSTNTLKYIKTEKSIQYVPQYCLNLIRDHKNKENTNQRQPKDNQNIQNQTIKQKERQLGNQNRQLSPRQKYFKRKSSLLKLYKNNRSNKL